MDTSVEKAKQNYPEEEKEQKKPKKDKKKGRGAGRMTRLVFGHSVFLLLLTLICITAAPIQALFTEGNSGTTPEQGFKIPQANHSKLKWNLAGSPISNSIALPVSCA